MSSSGRRCVKTASGSFAACVSRCFLHPGEDGERKRNGGSRLKGREGGRVMQVARGGS